MEHLSTLFDFVLTSIVLEAFALPFLLGLVLFVIGLALIVLFFLSGTLGYRTSGKVIGAIERKRTKKKERDGKMIEKTRATTMYTMPRSGVRCILGWYW